MREQKKTAEPKGTELLGWPALPWNEWRSTLETLQMWTQIVGKVRLALGPMMNAWWQVPLYVTSRGLTTSPIPFGPHTFEVNFDFIDHELEIVTSSGSRKVLPLVARTVKSFYAEFSAALKALGIDVKIWSRPVEVTDPIPFEEDEVHASYDPTYVRRFHDILVQSSNVFTTFRAKFTGKASPVHFFWGTFDLSVSLFSGRPAAESPPDRITRIAFADEQFEFGFWAGDGRLRAPAYYSFTYPRPPSLEQQPIRPPSATWNHELGEFILLYDDVRRADSPTDALLQFLQSTYEAGAHLLGWPRAELERMPQLAL